VRSQQHLSVTVLRILRGFRQGTGYIVDAITPLDFCHSLSAIGSQKVDTALLNRQATDASAFPHRSKATLGAPLFPTRQTVPGILYAE